MSRASFFSVRALILLEGANYYLLLAFGQLPVIDLVLAFLSLSQSLSLSLWLDHAVLITEG